MYHDNFYSFFVSTVHVLTGKGKFVPYLVPTDSCLAHLSIEQIKFYGISHVCVSLIEHLSYASLLTAVFMFESASLHSRMNIE